MAQTPEMAAAAASATIAAKAGKGARVDTFICPPDTYVDVDAHELKMAFKNRLELKDRPYFDDLTKLMEGVANFDFIDLKNRMRTNFLPFASGARGSVYLQRSSKNLPTTPVLDKKEDDFVADVYEVLRASHYTLLTKEEWDLAVAENFNLNLPMEVNWDYMEQDLLTKFWASSPERQAIRAALPDCMADRILVFHRGIGTERLGGLLMDQKLDLLMDYTVFHLLGKVKGVLKKKETEEEQRKQNAVNAAFASARDNIPVGAAMGHYEFEGNVMIGSKHKFARTVERNTLARQCPTLLTLIKAFPSKMELQEPTFKDIVVVYRRALAPRKPPTASANAPNRTKEERMQGILAHRNINIKVFGETPMADVEMIFPEKKVGIKPFQLVNLAVTLIMALVTGALVIWRAGKDVNMNILWTAASLVATRCFTVYNTAQTQRTLLQQQMTSTLYDKMQDSQEGVVSVILEEMADQQLKQMLLAYMLLVIKGRALLHDDLDNACEDFLYKEFNHPIDFDLSAALPRLRRWGLVRENTQGKLEAMPMPEAIRTLEAAWSTAYKVIGNQGADVPTKDMITGEYSVFGAGIDRYNQEQAAFAAAEAEAKRGSVFTKASGAPAAVLGKARGIFGGKDKGERAERSDRSVGGVAPSAAALAAPTPSSASASDAGAPLGYAPASKDPSVGGFDDGASGSHHAVAAAAAAPTTNGGAPAALAVPADDGFGYGTAASAAPATPAPAPEYAPLVDEPSAASHAAFAAEPAAPLPPLPLASESPVVSPVSTSGGGVHSAEKPKKSLKNLFKKSSKSSEGGAF